MARQKRSLVLKRRSLWRSLTRATTGGPLFHPLYFSSELGMPGGEAMGIVLKANYCRHADLKHSDKIAAFDLVGCLSLCYFCV